MRIALYHNHPAGGAARAMSHVGAILAERHELDVFTLSTADDCVAPDGASVRRFPFARHAPARFGLYLNEWHDFRDVGRLHRVNGDVAAEIDDGRYDVVLASACRFAQAPPVLAYLKTPSVYFCHEPPRRFIDPFCRPEAFERSAYQRLHRVLHRPAHSLVEKAWQRSDRRAVLSATTVLTNSRFTQGRIREYYGIDATVTYLGVDCARFSEATRDGDYVLSVGAIENHKGYDFLVRALSRVPPRRRPSLLLVGNTANGSVLNRLTSLASACEVNLIVRQGLSEHELAEAYVRARAFVYSPLREPFGLVVLEAMASALPLVAVAEGGVVESIDSGETGILVKRDENAFADALDRMLHDPNEAKRLAKAARAHVQAAWTWETTAARIEVELERVGRATAWRQPEVCGAFAS